MNTGTSAGHDDILDWLHEQGKKLDDRVPELDVDEIVRCAHGALDAYASAPGTSASVLRERPGAVNFWRALSPTEQEAFVSAAAERTFAAGAVLMREHEPAHDVTVILDGWTKICVDERVMAERGPGQLVGERGAAPGGVRSATVIAIEPIRALVMTTADFAVFLSEHPNVIDLVDKQVYDRQTERPSPQA